MAQLTAAPHPGSEPTFQVDLSWSAFDPDGQVGGHVYDDPDVLNGFLYVLRNHRFYAITAVDSSGAAGANGTPGTLLMREGRRSAVEGDGVLRRRRSRAPVTAA